MEVSASQAQFKVGHKLQWLGIGRRKDGLKNDPASSDAQLTERLKQRDEHAFLNLYDLHRISVYRFLMHMTGSMAVAEELTQEVFVVILELMCSGTVGQFDPNRGTWEGYLLGIARNLARAEQRRAGRLVDLGSFLENPDWERLANVLLQENRNWDIAAQMEQRFELTVLYRAILELPAHYREAVVLCSLQEKSYRDAAAILQCSEGTVASRMSRAKALLAAKLRMSAPNKLDELAILRGKGDKDV